MKGAMKPQPKPTTLLFLRRKGEILLAMKKRGYGVGRWNGVGGKADPGETIEQTAVRECQEEIGVTPLGMTKVAHFAFYMSEDPTFCHDCHIFEVLEWEGDPIETEEMNPKWFALAAIPYNDMWPDDRLWLPRTLAGEKLAGSITIGPNDVIARIDIAPTASL